MQTIKRRSVFLNSVFNLIGWVIPIFILFITVPIFKDRLGEEQYGIYLLVTTIISFVALLNFGTSESVIKYVSEGTFDLNKKNNDVNNIINTSFTLNILTSIIIIIFVFLFKKNIVSIAINNPYENINLYQELLMYGVGAFCITFITNTFLSFFKGIQRFDVCSVLSIFQSIFINVGYIIILFYGGKLRGLMQFNLFFSIGFLILCMITVKYYYKGYGVSLKVNKSTFNKLFSFSKYTFLMSIIGMVVFNADKLIIGAKLNSSEVTYYSVPANLGMKIHNILSVLLASILPKISQLYALNLFDQIKAYYIKIHKFAVNILVALLIPSFIYANKLLLYWLGPGFASKSTFLFRVLLVAYVLLALSSVGYYVSYGINRPDIYAKIYLFMAIVNVIINLILIPLKGGDGAALATLISNIFVVFLLVKIEKLLGISKNIMIKTVYTKALYVGVVQGFITLLMNLLVSNFISLFVAGSISFIGYFIIYIFLFRYEDEIVQMFIEKIKSKLYFARWFKSR